MFDPEKLTLEGRVKYYELVAALAECIFPDDTDKLEEADSFIKSVPAILECFKCHEL